MLERRLYFLGKNGNRVARFGSTCGVSLQHYRGDAQISQLRLFRVAFHS